MNVLYDEEAQNEFIRKLIDTVLSGVGKNEQEAAVIHMEAAMLLNRLSFISKNPSFKEESEVRIIHTPLITTNEKNEHSIHGNFSDLKYRATDERLVSYFEYDFSELNGVIEEVILGPKCQISQYDLGLFTSISGIGNIKYKYSAATYR